MFLVLIETVRQFLYSCTFVPNGYRIDGMSLQYALSRHSMAVQSGSLLSKREGYFTRFR